LKTTRYFEEQVLRKRPYLRREWFAAALQAPTRREVQPDGRIRLWIEVRFARQRQALYAARRDAGGWRDHPQRVPRPNLSGVRAVKLHYYPETDSLYIELKDTPGVETREIADGLNADLDADGVVVGLDIDRAAATLDLSTLEAVALPLKAA
jgi:uncharacterized protein YuzE